MRLPLMIAAIAALSGAALAQNASSPSLPEAATPVPAPSPAQRGAVMQACRADILSLCAGMTPGDGKLGQCIRANREKLSTPCQSALQALRGAGRPAPASPPPPAQ
ncbi:hypothetical protein [Sphingomonas sp. 28-63-12]|uniref:hypothetical protein n=1 Tax=Sphingomonas sp. 28-63-12 TaxID=1970434 RepID=UPI000BD3BADF|nr:MAG: hypothetical protein B7Y47_16350 [Sphingomonas sp. 28-63-12]